MGQAKKRGTPEDRLKQAIKRYHEKLEKLSQYGISVEELDKYFEGDEFAVTHYLEQMDTIVHQHQHQNVVGVSLRIEPTTNKLSVSIGVVGNQLDLHNKDKQIYEALKTIQHKKPENKDYSMKFATIDKKTLSNSRSDINPYDITSGKSEEYFSKIISKEVPDIKDEELKYYAELLTIYSNHPAYTDRVHSFFFEELKN